MLERHPGGGPAENKGLVADEPGKVLKGYKEFLNSYNAYSMWIRKFDSVTPKHVEVWDTSDGAVRLSAFIDFDSRTVEVKPHDR